MTLDEQLAALNLLVVEDNPSFAMALARCFQGRVAGLRLAATVAEAKQLLHQEPPSVVLLDMQLPDGTGFEVLTCVQELRPMPATLVITSDRAPEHAFRLGQAGVRRFLAKPVALAAVEEAIGTLLDVPPDATPFLRAAVGREALHTVEGRVRETMLTEAMARAGGSKSGAARLLSVSRQTLQHMLRLLGHDE